VTVAQPRFTPAVGQELGFRPGAPTSLAETGLDIGILAPLALKLIYYATNIDERSIGRRLALAHSVTTELLQFLRREGLCEVTGGVEGALGASRYALTGRGMERAVEALDVSGYVGPAPVPLEAYVEQVRRQSVFDAVISPDQIERGLAHLVLAPGTRDLIGQAITSKRAALLYGKSGNGKTSAALGVAQAVEGEILIPHAIEVMREIVQLYDASVHTVVEPAGLSRTNGAALVDQRWLVIKRPTVFAAGELAKNQLDLMLDEVHKTYAAPIQLKANGGVLIVDDFGRQRLDAAYLLNRWITPLEQSIDYLALHSGARFEVPFDTIPVFVSNRAPEELADDAFLRRIRYKIEVTSPDEAQFAEIMRRECRRLGVAYREEAARHLVEEHFRGKRELRGCHPRDVVETIADAARYKGLEPDLTPAAIDAACRDCLT